MNTSKLIFLFQINPKIANMNFRPVKLESPFFKQLKNYKQLQEDFGKLQDDTGVNEMESFLKIEVRFFCWTFLIFNSCALFQPSRNHKIVDPTELLLSKLEEDIFTNTKYLNANYRKNFVYKPIYGQTNRQSFSNENVDINTSPIRTIYDWILSDG